MGTVRAENAINERRILNRVLPAVQTHVLNSTIGTPLWLRIDIDDPTTVAVTDVSTAYDLEDLKTLVDAIENSGSDALTAAKDADGVVSITAT